MRNFLRTVTARVYGGRIISCGPLDMFFGSCT